MSKRSKAPQRRPVWQIIGVWLSGLLSIGLTYVAGSVFYADIGSFRSCSANSSGLTVSNCGKQSLNIGDVILFVLFALAACLMVTLFTAAWRMTRRSAT